MCYTKNIPYNKTSKDLLDWKLLICGKSGLPVPILQATAKLRLFYMAQAKHVSVGRSASAYH